MKTIRYSFLLYVLAFAVFVASHFYFSRNQEFTYLGDNITYLTGSESAYYDHDFTIDVHDFKRFSVNHPQIPLEIPIIGKETTTGTFGVSKPLVFMMYFSLFTPMKDELLRAVVANSIIFSTWFAMLYLLVRKIKDTWWNHLSAVTLFTILLFLSQANFYLNVFHPEIFINTLVLFTSIPLLFPIGSITKRQYFIFFGLIGSLLISEKQLALFFPFITAGYLFWTKRWTALFSYTFGLFIGGVMVILLYQMLYGTFTPYDGDRGMIRFIGGEITFNVKETGEIFAFPALSFDRFMEYFFGRNIGLFIYNTAFLIYISLFVYFYRKKEQIILFLPVFLYVFVYFFIVSPYYSYGGATSLGNRYFFQIYSFVIFVIVISFLNFKKLKQFSFFLTALFPVLVFSFLIYSPYYHVFHRAIKDHIIVPENKKLHSLFPHELDYARLIYTDLHGVNQWQNLFIINKGYPLNQYEDSFSLISKSSYVIFFPTRNQKELKDVMQTNGTIKLINNKNEKAKLYEVTCASEPCLVKDIRPKDL